MRCRIAPLDALEGQPRGDGGRGPARAAGGALAIAGEDGQLCALKESAVMLNRTHTLATRRP